MNVLRILIVLFSASLLFVTPVTAGPLRIALLSETTVSGDSIFLSNLLPPQASPELKSRAMNFLLGRAPALGSIRIIGHSSLTAALLDGDFVIDQFTIPEQVTVHRTNSGITKEDVARAINERLASADGGASYTLSPNDLEVDPPVVSAASHSGLEITEIAHDRALNCTRFRLRLRANPKIPPFYAWISSSKNGTAQPSDLLDLAVRTVSASTTPQSAPGVALVDPRRLASLHLHSANMTTVVLVRPLQTGQSGDTIRVRIPKSGKTLLAKVIGTDAVEAML